MAKQLQLRKGTDTEHNTFTGANGEVTVDTTNKTLRVHDGSTVGGTILATRTGGLVPAAQLPAATTSTQGIVKLNNTLTSSSTTEALTAAQGKVLKDTLDNTAVSSLGVGQTWQNLTASRAVQTIYTNTTGKPIQVAINYSGNEAYFDIGGVEIYMPNYNSIGFAFFIIPNGTTYRIRDQVTAISWSELR